ncbi:hypothetical protein FACS189430_07840 [Bacteroidia bacterium]|nr:hypothetical protein FACS189430_07840 [Bacteroidia bacterium]
MDDAVLYRVIENDLLVDELSLPSSWRGARVELRIIHSDNADSVVNLNDEPSGIVQVHQLAGVLSQFSDPSKMENETDGWNQGMNDKYGLS